MSAHHVVTILDAWARGAPVDVAVLAILCRKADIGKKLYCSYTTDWKTPVDQTPLPAISVAQLFRIVRAQACITPNRGVMAKSLNTMLNLVDIGALSGDDIAADIAAMMEAVCLPY